MPSTAVFVSQKQLATLWGVKQPAVSKILGEHGLRAGYEDGIDLETALEARAPKWMARRNFDQCLANATALRDGVRVEPVQAARDLGIYELSMPPYDGKPRGRPKSAPSEPANATAALSGRVDRADALAAARLAKLQAETEGRELRTKREAGELLDRKLVTSELKAACAVIHSTFNLLPARLAAPLPVEHREEAMRTAEEMLERCLYSILTALGDKDGQ